MRSASPRKIAHAFGACSDKVAAMSESQFWKDIESLGWGTRTTNYKILKKHLLQKWTAEEAKGAGNVYSKLSSNLEQVLDRWAHDEGEEFGLGDDGFSDLIAHIIGMGKREYDASIKNPRRAWDRAQKNQYIESFHYALPWEEDYKKKEQGLKTYQDWAKKIVKRYSGMSRVPMLKPIAGDLEVVGRAMILLLDGQVPQFMDTKDHVEECAQRIADFCQKLRNEVRVNTEELTNPWTVKNLYSDIRDEYMD